MIASIDTSNIRSGDIVGSSCKQVPWVCHRAWRWRCTKRKRRQAQWRKGGRRHGVAWWHRQFSSVVDGSIFKPYRTTGFSIGLVSTCINYLIFGVPYFHLYQFVVVCFSEKMREHYDGDQVPHHVSVLCSALTWCFWGAQHFWANPKEFSTRILELPTLRLFDMPEKHSPTQNRKHPKTITN